MQIIWDIGGPRRMTNNVDFDSEASFWGWTNGLVLLFQSNGGFLGVQIIQSSPCHGDWGSARGKRENSKSSSADSMAKPEKYRKVLKSGELATVLESKSTHFSRKVDHCHGILGWCISEPLHAINWHTVQQINSFHLDCGRIFWNPPKGRNLKGYMAVPKVVTISNLKVLQRSWAKQTNQTVMAVESWTLSSLYYILWSPTDF